MFSPYLSCVRWSFTPPPPCGPAGSWGWPPGRRSSSRGWKSGRAAGRGRWLLCPGSVWTSSSLSVRGQSQSSVVSSVYNSYLCLRLIGTRFELCFSAPPLALRRDIFRWLKERNISLISNKNMFRDFFYVFPFTAKNWNSFSIYSQRLKEEIEISTIIEVNMICDIRVFCYISYSFFLLIYIKLMFIPSPAYIETVRFQPLRKTWQWRWREVASE